MSPPLYVKEYSRAVVSFATRFALLRPAATLIAPMWVTDVYHAGADHAE